GVLAMKATGQETLVGEGSGKSDIARLLRYVWSLPSVTAAVVGMPSLEFLRENATVARNFKPMPAGEMEEYSMEMSDANKHMLDRHFESHLDV
ncbi:MAG: aldo/keto reductase, partial [Bryobacterales bacterium]|nr:aldo/keto reductase [Bryobacterales bacterium]